MDKIVRHQRASRGRRWATLAGVRVRELSLWRSGPKTEKILALDR
jgi:hypothetical protein